MTTPIYFDNAATTSVDPEVLETMLPYFTEQFGNASSAHQVGRRAKVAMEDARDQIAALLGAEPSEIIFTSGGTESDNAILKGVLQATRKKEIITSPLEHHAILHPAEFSKMAGCRVTYLQPGEDGVIRADQVRDAITEETAIVSLMHVNNETGGIQPIREIAAVCREKGVPFHSDTVQSTGKCPIQVDDLGIHALSISAHKIHGPKGIGILYVRNGTPWLPYMQGGSQERRRRGGTSNTCGIVGLAKALELAITHQEETHRRTKEMRNRLLTSIHQTMPDHVRVNSPTQEDHCVSNIVNLCFFDHEGKGFDGEMLLLNLDIEGICVSNGSACTSGAVEPSHVLKGLGLRDDLAKSSIRISFSRHNTLEEVDYLTEKLPGVVQRMLAKSMS